MPIIRITRFFFLLLLCLQTSFLQAFEMTLNKATVETAMSMFFPWSQTFGPARLTLQTPGVEFSGTHSRIYLSSAFSVIENGQLAEGKLRISSQVAYEASTRQIQLKEPVVESIEFFQNNSAAAKSLEQTLKQNQGKIVPVIILLDLNKLGLSPNMLAPKELRVSDLGIVVGF